MYWEDQVPWWDVDNRVFQLADFLARAAKLSCIKYNANLNVWELYDKNDQFISSAFSLKDAINKSKEYFNLK